MNKSKGSSYMKRGEANTRMVKWWAFGFLMQVTLALCIIHELGHGVAAILSGARILRLSWTSIHTSFTSPIIVAAGVITELLVYGSIMIASTRKWSRVGFFATGAFVAAGSVWWISLDRVMMANLFGGMHVFWDIVIVLLIVLGYSTRRHRMWVTNTHLMSLVTGREAPWLREKGKTISKKYGTDSPGPRGVRLTR